MRRYVIIGGGIAGINCIEGIRSVDADGPITLVSAEEDSNYGRPLISYYLEGKTSPQRMSYRGEDFYARMGVTALHGVSAEKIDAKARKIALSNGGKLPYDELCVAAGSSPFVPPMEGLDTVPARFSFMTLADARALEQAVFPETRVLIVGGGLIGLKCAEGLHAITERLTVCDLAPHVLSSILTPDASELVEQHLESLGIALMLGDSAARFDGTRAYMRSGAEVEFDVLVLAIGVRPNVSLVKDAGGETGRGIVVDARMATTLPHVFQRSPAGPHRWYQHGLRRSGGGRLRAHELDGAFWPPHHDGRKLSRRGCRGTGLLGHRRRNLQEALHEGRAPGGIHPHGRRPPCGHLHRAHPRAAPAGFHRLRGYLPGSLAHPLRAGLQEAEAGRCCAMIRIDASEMDFIQLGEALRATEGDTDIRNCLGQRFIAAGMRERRIEIYGVPGNALGAYLDGATLEVLGNAQDAVGDTMNAGAIIVHGNIGDTAGYAMRGGEIYVRGNAGYRAGIHMKQYEDKEPVIVIGGKAGSFLGEYQAGGLIIVLGIDGEEPIVSVQPAAEADMVSIRPYLERFCTCFGYPLEEVLDSPFSVVTPDSRNPYTQMYVAN